MPPYNYKVLITTSGLGQRLGDLTKFTNKSLIRVGKKPPLSYIIEIYPKEVELVITVGYFAEQVKEFVQLAYPDRKFTFVDVDNFQGPGSSLGYSMLKAKDVLQCPFIFHASDTIIDESVPPPEYNWNGGIKGSTAAAYSSFNVNGDKMTKINDKGAIDFDYLHIGLVGIKDYADFWKALEEAYRRDPNDTSLNDCRAINLMLQGGSVFAVQEFKTWFDIGNVESLNFARKNIKDSIANLDKIDEGIYIFDDFVIKFFYNQKIVSQRAERAKILHGLVPELEGVTNNFYRYKYVKGDLYSRVVTPSDFKVFLNWANENLWKPVSEVTPEEFKKVCLEFYRDKTVGRINKFLENNFIKDEASIINGEEVPPLMKIIEQIDFENLANAGQYQFHGDCILDNIIKTPDGYCLLDWRQNFGGLLQAGDIYYDLAKLNHNLTVNHDVINDNLFNINITDGVVSCDIMRKNVLVECQQILHQFIMDKGYDLNRVKILTAIVWLNMSPLHHYPFNLFLYHFGKLNLWKAINNK